MALYQDLRIAITSILNADKIFFSGDFNSRIGCDHVTWEALWKYSLQCEQ